MYIRDTLISRRAPRGAVGALAGTLSDIGGAIKNIGAGAINFYGSAQQAAGAAAATQAQNQMLAQQLANKGPGIGTIALGAAAVGGIAFLLLRKKKTATTAP